MICPKCNKKEEECNYCENSGEVSDTLNTLYALGFRRLGTANHEYKIYLQKALTSQIETISIDIIKKDHDLFISKIASSGPINTIKHNNLATIQDIINFLVKD